MADARGRASGGGRGPAELTAHVRPRMLCLAKGTNSRLTIRDSAAGKNKSFCNYMPPPKMLARTGWPWARTQPADSAYSPCPASLTRRHSHSPTHWQHSPIPGPRQEGPSPRRGQCFSQGPAFRPHGASAKAEEDLGGRPSPFPGWARGLCQPSSKHELGWAPAGRLRGWVWSVCE